MRLGTVVRSPGRSVALRFVALLGSVLVGILLVKSPAIAVGLVFGVPVLLWVWNRPMDGVLLYTLMMSSGIWYEWYPLVPLLGGYAVYPHEVIFFLLVARAIKDAATEIKSHPALKPIVSASAVAVGSVAFAAIAGVARGQALGTTVNGIRGYMLIALIPVVAILVKTDAERTRFVRFTAVIICSVAALMGLQILLGPGVSVFPGARLDVGFEEASNIVRSHPPAVVLATVLSSAILALVLNLGGGRKSGSLLRLALGAGASVALLLSFWRSYWIAAIVGAGLTLLRHARRASVRVLIIGMLMASIVVIVGGPVLFPRGFATGIAVVDVAVERLANVFVGDIAQSGTILDRLYEFEVARETLIRNPVFGVGPGMPYGADAVRYRGGVAYLTSRGSAHNSFLSIYLYLGIVGVAAFGYLFAILLIAGLRIPEGVRGPASDALSAGLMGGVVVVLVATLVSNWLGNVSQLSAAAIALGVMVSALRVEAQ